MTTKGAKKQRVVTAEEVAELVDLEEGWPQKLLALPTDKLAMLLGDIANRGKIKTADIKNARTSLPSFSGAKWSDVAEKFDLPDTLDNARFEQVVTPMYLLPPSFHEAMFETAWHTQDVYQERQAQRREEARVKIMDPYLVPIIGLFQGRVIDKPEHAMLATEYATGGEVEHEIFMIGGILFFIIEFKLEMSLEDNVAQLFLEILSAAKANEKVDFAELRIYGLLTDLIDFHFYSYNPLTQKFAYDTTLVVNITRDVAFRDMIPANKIFGVILTAYIDGLEATLKQNKERQNRGDVSSLGSAPLQQMRAKKVVSKPAVRKTRITRNTRRKSTSIWEAALKAAQQCITMLETQVKTVGEVEINSTRALEFLAESVRSIPRASRLTGPDDPSGMKEVKDLAHQKVHQMYLDMMQEDASSSGS